MKEENNIGVETVLLNICKDLDQKGKEMYAANGNDSYIDRCILHDAKTKIYELTNAHRICKMTFEQKVKDITNYQK